MTAHLCLHLLVCVRLLGCKDFLLSLWRWPSDPRPSSCAFTGVSWFCWIFTKTNRVTSLTAPGETLAVNPATVQPFLCETRNTVQNPGFCVFRKAVTTLAFSPDGKYVATGEVSVWAAGDVQEMWRFSVQRFPEAEDVCCLKHKDLFTPIILKLSCSAHVLSHFMQIKQFYREYIISHCLHLERICPMETNKVVRIEF